MNVVTSTTVGWNLGDQIILAGVKRLLEMAWGDPIYYAHHDRNPLKLPSGGDEAHAAIRCGWADALVIAGSPGWTLDCNEIYQTALEHKTPIYLIGIGAGADSEGLKFQVSNNPAIADALSSAAVVICRDEIARDVAAQHAPAVELLPCPAIANGLWDEGSWPYEQRVALGEHYEGSWDMDGLVAHQITDLGKSQGRAFYSSSVEDYLYIYKGARKVLSSRLHASVLRRAFGLPVINLWPASDFRCMATWEVLERGTKAGITPVVEEYIRILRNKRPVL